MPDLDITSDFYHNFFRQYPLDNSLRRIPVTYARADIALLAPRTHAGQPYNERTVIFTDNNAYIKVKKQEGWEAMLKDHYDARVASDKGPPRTDNSWVRKIVEPIYAKMRRSRKKY